MKKILLLLIILIILIPGVIQALTYPTLHYQNAVVYDLTDDKLLYELKSDSKTSIASLTKLMTIITAIENTDDLNKTITYDQNMKNNVAWYASKAGFKLGDKLTFNDLLYAAMLPSGADATVALAISTSGSIPEFIKKMNELAKEIGMVNSNFVNVHGLDENNHYSTAEDIRKLLEYALENELFKKVYTTKEYTLSTGKQINSTVKKQSDHLNLNINKIIGSKTGYTNGAGLCISVLMNHQGHEIIFVTLNAPVDGNPYNITDALDLINFIEENYSNQILNKKNNTVKKVKVINSKITFYEIKASSEISLFLEKDYNKENFKIKYDGLESLSYKNEKGTKIGTVSYYYENKKLSTENIFLTKEIEPDYIKIINSNKVTIIIVTIIVLSLTTLIIFKIKKKRKSKNI